MIDLSQMKDSMRQYLIGAVSARTLYEFAFECMDLDWQELIDDPIPAATAYVAQRMIIEYDLVVMDDEASYRQVVAELLAALDGQTTYVDKEHVEHCEDSLETFVESSDPVPVRTEHYRLSLTSTGLHVTKIPE